jgi:prepilin-type N-terminal cleavage/methylation domain-containing protein
VEPGGRRCHRDEQTHRQLVAGLKIMRSPLRLPRSRRSAAFTLVELLTVVAIMAIVMGILAMSLSQGQGRGVQMAAAQVASGMGVARQTAITRNTDAMFIIAPRSGSSSTDFFPAEPFRYWAVVYSNRGTNTWALATDWNELPAGTVFMGLSGQGYKTINWNTDGEIPQPGTPFRPRIAVSTKAEWQHFNSFTNMSLALPTGSTNLLLVPFIGFKSNGRGFAVTGPTHMAIVLGEGVSQAAVAEAQIVLRSTNNITHVETDSRAGRIVVRPRDSYR